MHAPNHDDHRGNGSSQGSSGSHAARILSIVRERRGSEPVNHEGHRRLTVARLAASGRPLST